MSQTLLRGMPAVHAWIVLMPLASTTAYRPNITKLAPQTVETKRLKESYGLVYEALKLHQVQTFLGVRFGQNPSDAQVIQEIVSDTRGYLKRLAADSNLEAPVRRLQFLHVAAESRLSLIHI